MLCLHVHYTEEKLMVYELALRRIESIRTPESDMNKSDKPIGY